MIRIHNVIQSYQTGSREVTALNNLSVEIAAGQFVSVTGPSGCGKTTLLMTLGGMLRPTSGDVEVAGSNVYSLTHAERAAFRAQNIGFVFQMFHLVPYLSVLENVELGPGLNGGAGRQRAQELVERLGLSQRATHKPAELSAGEKQRTAIARAMLRKPKLILADEPTGNLDPENETEVFKILSSYHQEGGTVVVVTHGSVADEHSDRALRMREGQVIEDSTLS